MSVYEKAFDNLKENNIDVYPPSTHEGECTSPYVVLKDAGASKAMTYSSQYVLYDMMCYVPGNRYTDLQTYVDKCKEAMAGVYPMLMPTGLETSSFYDDTVKGWMVSVEYRNNRRSVKII